MPILIAWFILLSASLSCAAEWGTIMYPHKKTNVRAKRSLNSKIKGQLEAGQPVKVDFLKKNWYAVFKVKEKRRKEARALGYVPASHLHKSKPKSVNAQSQREKPLLVKPPKPDLADTVPIDIKNISFKTDKDGKESLVIEFNRFYTPAFYSIEGDSPKIVLDITNVSSFNADVANVPVGSKLIRQIRSDTNPYAHIVRIILDMEPSKNYFVHPVFNGKDNTYSLEISEEKMGKTP